MNEKQKRFVDEYIIHANVYRAAINAGYSENYARTNASKLLEKGSIKDYKDKRLKEMKNERTADAQEVMEYLTAVMRGEQSDEELILVPNGDFVSEVERHERRSDTAQRTKAAELLGKRYAMWTDKQITDTTERITIVNDLDE
ncbi:terminase small subunit [Jeotgalicoccus marinus]|uniref:terminase small subunit n=1 Tax=Jeotgalicoccus marinus TaxID=516700 RepID=UPI000410C1EA|nr:terminase small subunit [Jeotgalicoccus marinus]